MGLWSEVRRRVRTGALSKRQACKKYKLHWDTLTKILGYEEPPGYRQKAPREKPVLGPFVAECLRDWDQENVHYDPLHYRVVPVSAHEWA
jgi:hypothetical protein